MSEAKNLTTAEAAQYLGMLISTLQRLRKQGLGARYYRTNSNAGKNSRVLYSIKELDKFIENNLQQTA
jgi:hypothetical protein